MPEHSVVSDVSSELTIQLPISAADRFSKLFDQLNENKAVLGL